MSFLIPIVLLDLPNYIHHSLISLMFSSLLYHNFSNPFTKFIDYANIINVCSNIYFNDSSYSLVFITLYLMENIMFKTNIVKNIIYFLCYSKYSEFRSVNAFFFSSLAIYGIHLYRNEFTETQRWLWHLGQAMYIYSSLSIPDEEVKPVPMESCNYRMHPSIYMTSFET